MQRAMRFVDTGWVRTNRKVKTRLPAPNLTAWWRVQEIFKAKGYAWN
jgi:hypothetical protein